MRLVSAAVLSSIVLLAAARDARVVAVRDGEATEHDLATFAAGRRVALPKEATEHPEGLSANAAGQFLFAASDEAAFWLWDGRTVRLLDRGARRSTRAAGGRRLTIEAVPRCVLSADGRALYWFENESRTAGKEGADAAIDTSVTTTFRAWRTDLAGGSRSPVASVSLPPCRCDTGACSETCAEISAWTPDEGVGDVFIATRWIPGQIGATYVSSTLFRRSNGRWAGRELPRALETVLDASRTGEVIVHAVNDGGCCGWMNESADRTLVERGGKAVTVFDERREYRNDNYDVSFYTSSAKLSPDSRHVAMTVSSTLQAREDVRLSIDGKPNQAELERIRRSTAELPMTVVVAISGSSPARLRVPHAAVVGWLDETRLLLRRGAAYEVLDPRGGAPARVALPGDATVLVRSR